MSNKVDYAPINEQLVTRVIDVVGAGLVGGSQGQPTPGEMCVESAVCYAMGEPHSDQPRCVEKNLVSFKIGLNDADGWEGDIDRAEGLKAVAIAQLGSVGVLNWKRFQSDLRKALVAQFQPEAKTVIAAFSKTLSEVNDLDDLHEFATEMKSWCDFHDADGSTAKVKLTLESFQKRRISAEELRDFIMASDTKLSESSALHKAAALTVELLKKQRIKGTRYLWMLDPAKVRARALVKRARASGKKRVAKKARKHR